MNASRHPRWEGVRGKLVGCLGRHIRPNCQPASRLCVGFSGGLDSSVLLHLLAEVRQTLGFSLSAVHVHHGLSSQADAWALHCKRVCDALGVSLAVHHVAVRPQGDGLEAAARAARYGVFVRLDADYLVLAHHRDDQAETVLLQLLRGASLKGLAAMPEARGLTGKLVLLRPLLAMTRADIAAAATEIGLDWIDDASNVDEKLARNALRHGVLPSLIQRFPDAPRTLAQAAVQFSEAAMLLDDLADQDGHDAMGGGMGGGMGEGMSNPGLAISTLQALAEPRARNLLRRFLERAGAEMHPEAVREAVRQLCDARPDAQVRVVFGKHVLRRYRQTAVLEALQPEVEQGQSNSVIWRGESFLNMGGAGCLNFQSLLGEGVRLAPGQVDIRRRQGGERLKPGAGRPRRTLKNLLREAGIPAWQRGTVPLVYLDGNLVWAAGIGADSDWLAGPDQVGWLISWQARPNKAM